MKFYVGKDTVEPTGDFSDNIKDTMPAGLYGIQFSMTGEISFPRLTLPAAPKKLFGDVEAYSKFILDRFNTREKSMGVWLDGVKGTGKTIQSWNIVQEAINRGLAVFQINSQISGSSLAGVFRSFKQPVMLLFDEFDKVYGTSLGGSDNSSDEVSGEQQKSLLTLLDGSTPIAILSLIVTNNKDNVSSFIRGRTGRIRYLREYSYLDKVLAAEIARDSNPGIKEEVVAQLVNSNRWTMDTLGTILEELRDLPRDNLSAIIGRLNLEPVGIEYNWRLVYEGVNLGLIKYYSNNIAYSYEKLISRAGSDYWNIDAPEGKLPFGKLIKSDDVMGGKKGSLFFTHGASREFKAATVKRGERGELIFTTPNFVFTMVPEEVVPPEEFKYWAA